MPASFQIKMGLAIVGYPAVATALVVIAARLTRLDSRARQAALAAAAAAGLVTSHLVLAGTPSFPPIDSIGWVPITTALSGLLGIIVSMAPRSERQRGWATVVGLALAAAIAAYLAGKPTFATDLTRFAPLGAGAAAASAIALTSSWKVARRGFAVDTWLALLATAALSALCAHWGASASLAMLLGSMATTAGMIGIGGLVLRMSETAPAAQGVFIAHMAATMMYTHLYAKLPVLPMILLAAAVLMPALSTLLPGEGKRGRWVRATLAVALAVVLAGAAALLMHRPGVAG